MSSRRGNVAYMQDADDDTGSVIDGTTVTYAASSAPSPTKERMNTSKKKSKRRDSSSPTNVLTDSDTTIHPRKDKESRLRPPREKERPLPSSKKSVSYATRPSTKHSKTTPLISTSSSRRKSRDESTYYGVEPTITSASSRPRALTSSQRPASYYGASSKPPLSNMKYYNSLQTTTPPMPPTSYPPNQWAAAGGVSYPVSQSPAPPAAAPYATDYFGPRAQQQQLMARFSLNRPQSAMAHRPPMPIASYAEPYEPEESGPLTRRTSLQRKPRLEDDRARMPPPPRPSSARPLSIRSSPFAPPPAPPRRPSAYDDESFEGDGTLYHDVSPLAPYDYAARLPQRTRRPSVGATSIVYDSGTYTTEVAGPGSRRNSYLSSIPSAYEDKMRQASNYQEEINGGPTMPLTAETLRKASKTSSRSTRSSGSHDESDWRQSATTRTTRSSNEEDLTIRVKGMAVLEVGGAKMQCKDGAEINISSRGVPPGTRGSSDKSSYMGDDRRTRLERPANRGRASSQAASFSRTTPPVAYGYSYGYEYPTAPPPMPSYTTTPHGGWL